MNITFKNPGFNYSLQSIMMFQTDDQTSFWSDPLFYFYPQINRNELLKKDGIAKKKYLEEILHEIYEEANIDLDMKVLRYQEHFEKYRNQIENALSDAFELDAHSLFNDLTANITLNPISPRFLKEHYFDVFYKNSEKGALGLALHEVVHYFWFYVWNQHFKDSYEEYETPSLKWILSEMVVESIMSDERLSSINPYFPKENGGCVYPYFQDMMIEGAPILETLHHLYRNNHIIDFMEQSYAYCQMHEKEIRAHIKKSEG